MIKVKVSKHVDLKAFRKQQGLCALLFTSEKELFVTIWLTRGSVIFFVILNNIELKFNFFLDSEYIGNVIGIHLNDNTATVWL